MEWVETTGKTVEEAKEAALDELGVDAEDAEFEVLEEAKQGLFGRVRSEARIRARVRPVAPPAKDDRRRRNRGKAARPDTSDAAVPEAAGAAGEAPAAGPASDGGERPAAKPRRNRPAAPAASAEPAAGEPAPEAPGDAPAASSGSSSGEDRPRQNRRGNRRGGEHRSDNSNEGTDVEVALEEQGQIAVEFLQGLVGEFGLEADVKAGEPADDTIELTLTGSDLGLLIGPKGSTLLAIQDLTRTVVQRKTGANNGRIHVDVGGYRKKRSEALARFALQIADEVKSSGSRKALEPMSAPDRKVVHDTLTDVDGVSTVSEGEDARRRVVILPD